MSALVEDTLQQCQKENNNLTELSQVLSHLISDPSLCNTKVTQNLFLDYVEKVKQHMASEERKLYGSLLIHQQAHVKNTASMFLAGSCEIKRIFSRYTKRWCRNSELRLKQHDRFVAETHEMFEMIRQRIQDEKKKLYPLVEYTNEEHEDLKLAA